MLLSIPVRKGGACSELGTGRLIKVDEPTGTSFFTKCLRKIGLSKPRIILLPKDLNIRYDGSETDEMQSWHCRVDGRSYRKNFEYDVRMTKSDEQGNIITQITQRVRSGSRLEIEFGLTQKEGSEIPELRFLPFKENDSHTPQQLRINGQIVYASHEELTLENGKTVHVLGVDLTNGKPKGAVPIDDKQEYLSIKGGQVRIPPNAAYATYKGNIVTFYLKPINGETIYETHNKRKEDGVAAEVLARTGGISQKSEKFQEGREEPTLIQLRRGGRLEYNPTDGTFKSCS